MKYFQCAMIKAKNRSGRLWGNSKTAAIAFWHGGLFVDGLIFALEVFEIRLTFNNNPAPPPLF